MPLETRALRMIENKLKRSASCNQRCSASHLIVAGGIIEVALPGAVCRRAVAAVAVRRHVEATRWPCSGEARCQANARETAQGSKPHRSC